MVASLRSGLCFAKVSILLIINRVGLTANLIDSGRRDVQAQGFSQSGALDWVNYQLANAICGVALDSACIEILGGDFTCTFTDSVTVSVTGAHIDVFINQKRRNLNKALSISKGDVLVLCNLTLGFVSYIAIGGKFNCPQFGHSVCAVKREKVGGLHQNGQSLSVGDRLKFDVFDYISRTIEGVQGRIIPPVLQKHIKDSHKPERVLTVNSGYQSDFFSQISISMFYNSTFEVSRYFDRMGMRLISTYNLRQGAKTFSSLRSQGIVLGSIQVPENGNPIILRNDRQTIGGYPIIGIVDSVSLSLLGQAKQNDIVRFSYCDAQESETKRLKVSLALKKILNG